MNCEFVENAEPECISCLTNVFQGIGLDVVSDSSNHGTSIQISTDMCSDACQRGLQKECGSAIHDSTLHINFVLLLFVCAEPKICCRSVQEDYSIENGLPIRM